MIIKSCIFSQENFTSLCQVSKRDSKTLYSELVLITDKIYSKLQNKRGNPIVLYKLIWMKEVYNESYPDYNIGEKNRAYSRK